MSTLTPREKEILELLRGGLTVKDLAARLGTAENTVQNQLTIIRLKLGALNTTHAIQLAAEAGYLTPRIQLSGEEARQFGLKCLDCGSAKTAYFISFPLGTVFPPGAYCYKCLLNRCRRSRMIPFPIPATLLNSIKQDMGLKITTPGRVFRPYK